MPSFYYQALDAKSTDRSGTVVAESGRDARVQLRLRGLTILSIHEQRMRSSRSVIKLLRPRARSAGQVASAIRDLATLLSTGIGLVDALDTICLQYTGRFRLALQTLRERVAGGSNLSEAMQLDPEVFDELTVQMVRVGENAGTLDTVLDRLADFRERYLQFKDRVTTALIYPAIIVLLAFSVSIFLMTVVLPMLLENLVASGRPLPWPTRVLKMLSETLTVHGWWLGALAAAIVFGGVVFINTPRGKRIWHRLFFSLPILGPLAKKQEIARAAIIISTLMENGIVFVDAIETASRTAKNVLLKDALDAIRLRVQSGGDIGVALTATGIFPPLVIQIFTVGQQTGELERMLNRLASGYEAQVASATSRLTAALEPILIVVLAVVVGFILFATILPILEAGNVL
ncbi:type II secretion system F family protein [Schlesneria paludicola]|uniref:type II secretion system F family protein n=1 Tax=Schlesneria paludicola TaxID=360056 RepID=UPI0004924941|nr:type II secretion system F family protein [Schlesneria paludicola]